MNSSDIRFNVDSTKLFLGIEIYDRIFTDKKGMACCHMCDNTYCRIHPDRYEDGYIQDSYGVWKCHEDSYWKRSKTLNNPKPLPTPTEEELAIISTIL